VTGADRVLDAIAEMMEDASRGLRQLSARYFLMDATWRMCFDYAAAMVAIAVLAWAFRSACSAISRMFAGKVDAWHEGFHAGVQARSRQTADWGEG
jgi:hypothetical protein